jgi:molybdopterin/thiamine biosynthesis adenylyltransferase
MFAGCIVKLTKLIRIVIKCLVVLTKIIYNKVKEVREEENVLHPVFFRLSNEREKKDMFELINNRIDVKIYDTIASQLKELMKSSHPSLTLSSIEIEQKVAEHLGGVEMVEYGVWVYYPWNNKLVHLLDEEEFVLLRTNRNKYKITDAEESTLASKKVGVIGLSVGQSVSLTLAMERTFGELRIADFDDLEITNLNRLRSGVHNMGLLKTVLVAREIAEIDPYLKVTCFHEGITEDNLERFLLEGGKLDVLIDECDGVDVKIKSRIAARNHGIPVLMEASDRCTIDIERFDLQPDRPILHGAVEHLDISNIRNLKTMEEKLPYILPIVGIDSMSPRLKASAVEIGQSISTWPQLASAVTMGGGITADICRKVLLGQLSVSGRYFIDIDELIADPDSGKPDLGYNVAKLTLETMKAAAKQISGNIENDKTDDAAVVNVLVDAARMAPSAGNNQPWKWFNDGTKLLFFSDPERSAAFANFDNMITHMSMGAALENFHLKATEMKINARIDMFPLGTGSQEKPVACISISQDKKIVKDPLGDFLLSRHTNRIPGNGGVIPPGILEQIQTAGMERDVASVKMLTEVDSIARMAEIAGKAEKLRMFIPQGHSDLFDREIRWDRESAEKTRDGLDIRTLDLKAKDEVGFKVIRDPRAIELVSDWNLGAGMENMTKDLINSASAVCLISGHKFDPANCVNVGRAMQRAWLVAEKHNLAVQPVMASVFHFARLVNGAGVGIPENIKKEFRKLYLDFIDLFNLSLTSEYPLFLFRICYAPKPEIRSIRLHLDDIYFQDSYK